MEAGRGAGGAGRLSERENSHMKRINPSTMAMMKKRDGPWGEWPFVRRLALPLICAVDRSTQESSARADESPDFGHS